MRKLLLALVLLLCLVPLCYAEQFVARPTGRQVVPPNSSAPNGRCQFILYSNSQLSMNCLFSPTVGTTVHVHGPAAPGVEGPILFTLAPGTNVRSLTPEQTADLRAQRFYVDFHNPSFEVRGQVTRPQTISDYDGDGRTDPAVFRRSTGELWIMRSSGGYKLYAGIPDLGDAVYLTNAWGAQNWFVATSIPENALKWWWVEDNPTTGTVGLGAITLIDVSLADSLVPGDYNGDGRQDAAVYRRSDGRWFLQTYYGTDVPEEPWGLPSDQPCIGDYDGDGRSEICLVREENGYLVWYIRYGYGLTMYETWGLAGIDHVFPSIPVYLDDDGKQELMVYRDVGGQRVFNIRLSKDNSWVQIPWGLTTDTPLFGDYDGDGKTDFVARRDVNGSYVWYVLRSSDNQVQYFYWGKTGDE